MNNGNACSTPLYPLMERLAVCLDDLITVEGTDYKACSELKDKLSSHAFNLLVVGQFNRGKTTLINALIGEALLPVGVIPLTSVVTVLSFGEKPVIKVCFQDGHCVETTPESLDGYVTEKGNPHNVKGVREVAVSYPSPWLKEGICLVDTPGIGSVYSHNTDLAYRYLPKADAVLFLLSADQPVSQAECDFLRDVREYADRIFFLLNKADYLSETELREAVTFAQTTIAETMGRETFVAPVSARLALDGKLTGSPELIEKSLLPLFSTTLHTFLQKEKGQVLIGSVSRNLLRIISQARFRFDLELASLKTPLAELQEKIRTFEEEKREVMLAREEYGILLEGEAKRLLQKIVEPDLAAVKTDLIQQVAVVVERRFNEHQALPARQLSDALEQEIILQIREAFDSWRSAEDEKVGGEFEVLCSRITARINETIDELFSFSAELFAIPFAAVQADSLWAVESGFYYKFWSEPGSLMMFTSSVLLALPRFISDRLILKRMKEHVQEMVDMQSGRVRYDFAVRLDKSVQAFRREMLRRIEATVENIETALEKGTRLRDSGEREFSSRSKTLQEAVAKLDEIRERVKHFVKNQNLTGHDDC
ncbi:MAG TPA: dynamin family protein [Geobacteraceae bacterium]|nr:dynamin family protein [Geobacteraceae bacterium]